MSSAQSEKYTVSIHPVIKVSLPRKDGAMSNRSLRQTAGRRRTCGLGSSQGRVRNSFLVWSRDPTVRCPAWGNCELEESPLIIIPRPRVQTEPSLPWNRCDETRPPHSLGATRQSLAGSVQVVCSSPRAASICSSNATVFCVCQSMKKAGKHWAG